MADTTSSGIRLKNLLHNHHAEILSREENNDKFIHLYNIGTYWVAFEFSACGLNGLFPRCEIALFRLEGLPDYVVMASVPSDDVNAYFRTHIAHHDEIDHKVLLIQPFLAEHYYKWHQDAVNSVLQ